MTTIATPAPSRPAGVPLGPGLSRALFDLVEARPDLGDAAIIREFAARHGIRVAFWTVRRYRAAADPEAGWDGVTIRAARRRARRLREAGAARAIEAAWASPEGRKALAAEAARERAAAMAAEARRTTYRREDS